LDKRKTRASRNRSDQRAYILLNRQRKHAVDVKQLQQFLSSVVPKLRLQNLPFSVVLITDEVMRDYNRQYRGLDKSTDVLSFRGDHGYLGDILISSETAYNQTLKSRTLDFKGNLRRLILHGLLHLMGYDHETDNGEMRTIERRLRRRFQC
jgi:probable rRNA maturation factor